LKAMRRTYSRERYLRLVDELRAKLSSVLLETTRAASGGIASRLAG